VDQEKNEAVDDQNFIIQFYDVIQINMKAVGVRTGYPSDDQ